MPVLSVGRERVLANGVRVRFFEDAENRGKQAGFSDLAKGQSPP